ncbi:MAG: hypothetical protein FWD84_02870 [Oscillospiraceae bacterium]|nr:hypothetical protein [Oscillospiraceae bacterium]
MERQGISGLKIGMVYIGTVVGAGFATGQEVLQFFVAFGLGGLWGIALSTALFIGYGVLIMRLGMAAGAASHREILPKLGGAVFQTGMDALIMTSLFIALTAMLAGTGALFGQQFGLSPMLGSAVMGALTALTVLSGLRGVINAVSAVVPFLLVSVVVICVFVLLEGGVADTSIEPSEIMSRGRVRGGLMGNWLWAAILYASYNILMSAAVLAPLGTEAADRRAIFRGGALGGIGLGAASVMLFLAISTAQAEVAGLEVPILYLAARISPVLGALFALVLIAEIYTTAVGALYGFSARILGAVGQQKAAPLIVGAAALAFGASLLGFSNLVRVLYPLQGYGGIVFLAALLFARWRGHGKL